MTRWISKAVILAGLICPHSTRAALTEGLVSHWPLESDAGGIAADVVFENEMTIVGAPTVAPGKVGNSFLFDGASSYLEIQHTADNAETGLPIYRAGAYSISMWVKGPAQTAKYLFAEGSTTSNNPLLILQTGQAAANNAKFDVIIRNDASGGPGTLVNHVVSTNVVFDDNWHHVTWVDDNGNARLYIDGQQDPANFSYTPAGTFTFNSTAIGTLIRAMVSTGAIFQGQIDEVAIWERALSAAEVTELFQNGVPSVSQALPPVIDSAPANLTRRMGDWMRLSVSVSGTRPFTFQWFKNNQPIPGATEESYLLTGLTTANSGEMYHVTVSNAAGEASTTPVTLTVLPDPDPDVRAGLVNYWPMDVMESADSVLTSPDLYSGNDLVLVDFIEGEEIPGKLGGALSFDFVSRYAYRTNGSPIYNRTNYSIAFWVNAPFEGQNDRRVFSEGSSLNDNPLFNIGTDPTGANPSARIFIRNDDASGVELNSRISTRPVFDGAWHHVVWTDANGEGRLYIDGVLDETDFAYTRGALTLDQTSFGAVLRATPSNFFFGNVDDAATWSRVLSWTEIQSILTNGIPAPLAANPPAIITQPSDRNSGIFGGDTVSFSVQASGTEPLAYQWSRNGQPIAGASNPSALTSTLVLTNVQPADSGATFSVTITNMAGSVTSGTAGLTVQPYTPATSGTVLNIDVGLTGSPNVQPGFDEFNLALNGTNYNGVKVTLSGVTSTLAERNRTTGAMVANNPPTLTQAQLYNDFIFATANVDGAGMRILIERLAPNTPYEVTLWSFDPQSNPARISDWTEESSGAPVDLMLGYTFEGSVLPTADNDRTMTATLTSSAAGTLELVGRRNGGGGVAVFLNALRLVANPGLTSLEITEAQLVDGNVVLTVSLQNPDQAITIQQTDDLAAGQWTTASGGTVDRQGLTLTARYPATGSRMFYRVTAP